MENISPIDLDSVRPEVPVHSGPFLDPSECEKIWQEVLLLKHLWSGQGSDPQYPYFYTLGAAGYIDGRNSDSYRKRAHELNQVLQSRFSDLYAKLRTTLEGTFGGAPHRYDERYALPGFHIYPRSMPQGGTIHYDLQYRSVPWHQPERLDFGMTASFTIVIQTPNVGAGLRYWRPGTRRERAVDSQHPEIFCEQEYQTGHLYFFPGHVLHQMAPRIYDANSTPRVTLQAHSVWHRDGYWILYW